MAFEIITGPRFNVVGRGVAFGDLTPSVYSPTGTWSTRLPMANMYDGYPAIAAEVEGETGTGSALVEWYVSANLLTCGDGEQATPVGWTAYGTGVTVSTSATHAYRGAKSLKVTNTTGATACYAYQRVTVQSGETLVIDYGIGYPTAGVSVSIEVLDSRGYYLAPGGSAWQSAQTYFVSPAPAAAWDAGQVNFVAPTVSEVGGPETEIEVRLYARGAAGDAYGEILVAPSIDFVGLFGHTFPTSASIVVRGSADGSSPSVLATWSPRSRIGWYASVNSWNYAVYQISVTWPAQKSWSGGASVLSAGTTTIGEFVMGKRLAFLQGPDYPVSVEWQHRQARSETPSGSSYVLPRGYHPLRRVTMPLDLRETSRAQVRDSMLIASRFGANRCVLVPTEADSDLCILGRIRETATFARKGITTTACELEVLEDALPTMA